MACDLRRVTAAESLDAPSNCTDKFVRNQNEAAPLVKRYLDFSVMRICQRIPLLDSTTAIRLGNESAFTLSQSALSSFLQFRLDSAVSALRRVTGRVLTPRESSQFQYQFS